MVWIPIYRVTANRTHLCGPIAETPAQAVEAWERAMIERGLALASHLFLSWWVIGQCRVARIK